MTTPNTEPKPRPATDAEIARVTKQAQERGLYATWDRDTILPMAARIEQEREMKRELAQAMARAVQLASRAYDWGLGTDGKIQMNDGSWVACYDLTAEFKDALARAAKMEADNAK